MIAITLSTDWAPMPVIRYTLDILRKYDAPVTIFCTDDLNQDIMESETHDMNVELGIHPYINSEMNIDSKIKELRDKFPDAIGSKSHRYYSSSTLFRALKDHNFVYDSSVPILNQTHRSYLQYNGIIELPVGWADDVSFRSNQIDMIVDDPNLVFDIHPVHVFINTSSSEHYSMAKKDYHDVNKLELHRHGGKGIANKLICSLKQNTDLCLMRDLID